MFSGKAYPNWGLLAGDWGAPKMRKTNRKKIPPPPRPRLPFFLRLSFISLTTAGIFFPGLYVYLL